MKRLFLIVFVIILIVTMPACAFLSPEPQILLNGEEIETLTMEMGQDLTLSTNIKKNAVWKSSDDTVVKATSAGKLFALKEGTVTVTLTAGGKTDSITVTVSSTPTAWIIGDSIFDEWDNGPTSPLARLAEEAGYVDYCMDNIGGSTYCNIKNDGNSIEEHITSGLYADFYKACGEPDLIIIARSTNDVNLLLRTDWTSPETTLEEGIRKVCAYFSTTYPNARIIWSTTLWRFNIDVAILDQMRTMLHTICPEYGVEVFDLHLEEPFASLNHSNYQDVLSDGVHLTFLGALKMKDAFLKYLAEE